MGEGGEAMQGRQAAERALGDFLGRKGAGDPALPVPRLDAVAARRLVARIDAIPLFAHAYALHLNLCHGGSGPADLLAFAAEHELVGLKIHVEDGEDRSLAAIAPPARRRFGALARERGIRLHVETSSTTIADLRLATAIAGDVGAESIRCYPRHAGPLSAVIARTIRDLAAIDELDPRRAFRYTVEQHEDLTSAELVAILRAVGNPRLSLLYDFGNMINAGETPEGALATMAPLVTEVHVKDVRRVPDRGGWGHLACRTGTGEINIARLLFHLLLLGEPAPQVTAFALEEEEGYLSPAFRFPDEAADPVIPPRGASVTPLDPAEPLADRLAREREAAADQVRFVRVLLAEMRRHLLPLCVA